MRDTREKGREVEKLLKIDLKTRLKAVVGSSKYSEETSSNLLVLITKRIERLKKITAEIIEEVKTNPEGILDYEQNIKSDLLVIREILIKRIEDAGKIKFETNAGNQWDFMMPPTFMNRSSEKPVLVGLLEAKIYESPQSRKHLLEITEELEMILKRLQG